MLKVHYDLLHEIAEKLHSGHDLEHMEEDPDAYLASMLNLINDALKHRRTHRYQGSRPLNAIIDAVAYKPYMKKMRKLLDQDTSEYVPELLSK
jgi:hypothetical protein